MNTSIHHSERICKRLLENNLPKSVKTVSEPYVVSIMVSMFQAGYCSPNKTLPHFLSYCFLKSTLQAMSSLKPEIFHWYSNTMAKQSIWSDAVTDTEPVFPAFCERNPSAMIRLQRQ